MTNHHKKKVYELSGPFKFRTKEDMQIFKENLFGIFYPFGGLIDMWSCEYIEPVAHPDIEP